jgi:hypothetical protein
MSASTESATRAAPGASWAGEETHVVPKNNLPVVLTGLALCIFLAAIDQVWGLLFFSFYAEVILIRPSV